MKAMILAAGLGTRLKPWTDLHPKALAEVEGKPVLGRLIDKLVKYGFFDVTVNIHHFGEQIIDYIKTNELGADIKISDERDELLDTGGGLVRASGLLRSSAGPILVHNVDILSNQDLNELMAAHKENGYDITLLTSDRASSRRLIFDKDGQLRGWHDTEKEKFRPDNFVYSRNMVEVAFSGIYIIEQRVLDDLRKYSEEIGKDAFPIMDYLLSWRENIVIGNYNNPALHLLDIGKPESLAQAKDYI